MTAEELIAIVSSIARHLSSKQRILAARFVGVLATHSDTIKLATDDRARRDRERVFEERELGPGPNLERRRREIA